MKIFKRRYLVLFIGATILIAFSSLVFNYQTFRSTFSETKSSIFPYNQINYIGLNAKDISRTKLHIAIVDTGFDKRQTSLNKYPNIRYLNLTHYPDAAENIHGSAMAGILLNSEITKPLMGHLMFSLLRVGSDKDINVDDLAKGIQKAIDLKADIINISLGTYEDNQFLRDSIKRAISKGIIVVCAAGNDYTRKYLYPASYEGVISVSSVDQNGIVLLNNNFNDKITISAPGEKIPSMVHDENGQEVFETGSSPACVIITSIVTMMKALNDQLSVSDMKKIFQVTASKYEDKVQNYTNYYGFGIVNYQKSVMCVKSPLLYRIYTTLEIN